MQPVPSWSSPSAKTWNLTRCRSASVPSNSRHSKALPIPGDGGAERVCGVRLSRGDVDGHDGDLDLRIVGERGAQLMEGYVVEVGAGRGECVRHLIRSCVACPRRRHGRAVPADEPYMAQGHTRGVAGESADKPDSVPAPERRRRPSVWDLRCRRPRAAYLVLGGPPGTHLLGLAPDGVYLAADVTAGAGALLPHPFTLTSCRVTGDQMPRHRSRRRLAVCSLWHCSARRRAWGLPSVLPCGVRTFLDGHEGRRGRLADSPQPA